MSADEFGSLQTAYEAKMTILLNDPESAFLFIVQLYEVI